MLLAEFARVVDASPKWVLNTMPSLPSRSRYTEMVAKRLIVARAIHSAFGTSLPDAFALAHCALREWDGSAASVTLRANVADDVSLTIDVYRLMAAYHMRRAELRESYAPMVRGRPRTRSIDAVAVAVDWGLDLSLIRDNLRKSPAERLRQLDAMRAFTSGVRRVSP